MRSELENGVNRLDEVDSNGLGAGEDGSRANDGAGAGAGAVPHRARGENIREEEMITRMPATLNSIVSLLLGLGEEYCTRGETAENTYKRMHAWEMFIKRKGMHENRNASKDCT